MSRLEYVLRVGQEYHRSRGAPTASEFTRDGAEPYWEGFAMEFPRIQTERVGDLGEEQSGNLSISMNTYAWSLLTKTEIPPIN